MSWRLAVTKDEVGQFREATSHPTKVEVPNIKLTISAADLAQWQAWAKQAFDRGRNAALPEVTGAIEFLAPDLEEVLARIDLFGLRPVSLNVPRRRANRGQVARFTVELYCERMAFTHLGK